MSWHTVMTWFGGNGRLITIYLIEDNKNGDCIKKYAISLKDNMEAIVVESVRINGSCLWANEVHRAKIKSSLVEVT